MSIPTLTAIHDSVGSQRGALAQASVTDDTRLALAGTAEAGAVVQVYDGDTLLGGVTANADGRWLFHTTRLTDGQTYQFRARHESDSDDGTAFSETHAITVDVRWALAPQTPSYGNATTVGQQTNGFAFAALKADGSVVTWGDATYGGSSASVQTQLQDVVQLFSSGYAFAALKANGSVVTWGWASGGGDSTAAQPLQNVVQVFSTTSAFAALKADGSVATWGPGASGGNSNTVQPFLQNVVQIFSNQNSFAALKADGSVVTWGAAANGGNSASVQPALQNVVQVFATANAFAALKADGSVVTWGAATSGGNSDPVQPDLQDVVQVFSTSSAFAALKADGSVVTWGAAANGANSAAVQAELQGVVQMSSTSSAFAALKADGSVVTWGAATSGGNSATVQTQLQGVVQVFATSSAFAALKADGSVVTWGNATLGANSAAVQPSLTDVQQVFSTTGAFAALKADGSVVTWGSAAMGGDSSAAQAGLQSGVVQVFSTGMAFAALKADGSVVTWGAATAGGSSTSVQAGLAGGVLGLASPLAEVRRELDTQVPTTPEAPTLAAASDSGTPGDDLTNDATPTLSGTAETGSLVRLYEGTALLGSARADSSGAWQITPSLGLSDGSRSLHVTATDAAGNTSQASPSLAITIDATAPADLALDGLQIAVNAGADSVVGSLSATDAGALSYELVTGAGDDGNAHFQIVGDKLQIIDPAATGIGTYSVRIAATDGAGNSTEVNFSIAVESVNQAPVVALPLADQAALRGQLFSFVLPAHTFSDPDVGDTLSYVAQLANGDPLPAWLSFDANSLTFSGTPARADVGTLEIEVIATDSSLASVSDSFTLNVARVNDAPTGSVTITGLAQQNQTLEADTRTLGDPDGLGTLSYQWLRGGTVIADATDARYTLTQADVGQAIGVRVRYTDGAGTPEQVEAAPTQAVVNVNDLPTGQVYISGTPSQGQTLTALHTLQDVDGLGAMNYQWLRAGQVIEGATGRGYTVTDADAGQQLSVRLSYVDGQGTPESVSSPSLTVGPLAPPSPSPVPGAVDWAHYPGPADDYVLSRDAQGQWQITMASGGEATSLAEIERVVFADKAVALDLQDGGLAEQAARLVVTLWGQEGLDNPVLVGEAMAYVDALGLQPLTEVAEDLGLLAALVGSHLPAALLTLMHENLVGRTPNAVELGELMDFQASGNFTAAQLLHIALGLEVTARAMDLPALAQQGLPFAVYVGPLYGSSGNDVLRAQQGDDEFHAHAGIDTVVYGAVAADYVLARQVDGSWTVTGEAHDGGQDRLWDVERLQFADHAVALDLEGHAGTAARLLASVLGAQALEDRARVGELIAYVDEAGAAALVRAAQAHGVLDALAGGDSLEALVTLVYRNVTGARPSEAELQWALETAQAQQWDRADLLLYVAELPQVAQLIGQPVLAGQGLAYEVWGG